jgi:CHAD domain-containing protein
MPYRIKRRESVPAAIRRIALEQTERAISELRDTDMDAAEAVHQARKRFKKLRSLLRLIRPSLAPGRYKQANRHFRKMGRQLAEARDAEVMLETLDTLLENAAAGSLSREEAGTIRLLLESRRDGQLSGGGQNLRRRMAGVAGDLEAARARVAGWKLGVTGFAAVGRGLKRSYRDGRKAMREAWRHPDDAQFHEWRKRVKDHWYHSRLLQRMWPGLMQAHSRELKQLSDLLGDDHDLAVFRQTVARLPDGSLRTGTRRRILDQAILRQNGLRREARYLGERIYAESPKRFHKRWHAYWRTWRSPT